MIRVLLADDHELLRSGVAGILESDADLEVVGEVEDGPSAVKAAQRLQPDVVLMDVQMPGGDGITATADVLAACPSTRVMVLTMFDLDEYVIGALRAGASGFLIKTTPAAELVVAVKACAAGDATFGPSIIDRLVESFVQRPGVVAIPAQMEGLTPRERDVLLSMAKGHSNAEIAAELYLAETTVKTHVARILCKLGLRDRVQAVVLAHQSGFAGTAPLQRGGSPGTA
ncbi:MAG: response regulator transcription factor [Ornithinimicrobium sp.]|uniref:response regulator n=1 Tax=Ornithinimicrobium sp. TaxID=1977084 RepID=UPI0026DFF8AB|nr:response regulator transcription factor [Ornithinimicrobium sp.]MDO5739960.1 response regulator transcription factor [Ornithinimicrobium sp.]